MNNIEIYGYAAQEICAGCEGHCGDGECTPGSKKTTDALVTEFKELLRRANIPAEITFYEATDENLARHEDVHRVLSLADLTPAIVLNGKLLFLGGFSPEGLVEEIRKRLS